jgi:uncharacterized protein (TIGR02996 family)
MSEAHTRSGIPAELLEQMLDEPNNDAPRLVYADQLQEKQDPYGEFIHIDCALARSPKESRDVIQEERRNDLLAKHGKQWTGVVSGLAESHEIQRGFVKYVEMYDHKLVSHANELFEAAPLLSDFRFHTFAPSLGASGSRKLAAIPYLRQIQRFMFSIRGLTTEGVVAICSSPHLMSLRCLELYSEDVRDEGLEALASSHLRSLRTLRIRKGGVGAKGVQALAQSPVSCGIEMLDLWENNLGPAGAIALSQSPYMENVQTLALANNQIGDDALIAFAESSAFPSLTGVAFNNNQLTDRCVNALCEAPFASQLEALHLQENRFGPGATSKLQMRFGTALFLHL